MRRLWGLYRKSEVIRFASLSLDGENVTLSIQIIQHFSHFQIPEAEFQNPIFSFGND